MTLTKSNNFLLHNKEISIAVMKSTKMKNLFITENFQ